MTDPTDYTAAFLEKAHEALDTARLNSDNGHQSAALYRSGEAPRSHKGVRTRFYERYVRSGRLDRPTAAILSVAEEARRNADYDAFTVFDRDAALDLVADVERFVSAVEDLLRVR